MAEEIAQHSFAPAPDPTVLTTQQLQREIAASRDLLDVKIDGLRSVIDTRLSAADQTITLLRVRVDQIPENIHQAIERTQELRDEKFKSISIQFLERDTRTEQQSRDAKVAVDAALQAAKKVHPTFSGSSSGSSESSLVLAAWRLQLSLDSLRGIINKIDRNVYSHSRNQANMAMQCSQGMNRC